MRSNQPELPFDDGPKVPLHEKPIDELTDDEIQLRSAMNSLASIAYLDEDGEIDYID